MLNVCTMMIVVLVRNHTTLRKSFQSRSFVMFKGALIVFCFCFAVSILYSLTGIAYFLRFKYDDFINNTPLLGVLELPFYQRAIELLLKKIFHDEKFIIGEVQSSDGEDGNIPIV